MRREKTMLQLNDQVLLAIGDYRDVLGRKGNA